MQEQKNKQNSTTTETQFGTKQTSELKKQKKTNKHKNTKLKPINQTHNENAKTSL